VATVAQKTFYANLYDEAGTLARIDNALVFFADAGDITTVEPADINFLVVLGETGIANTQQLLDRLHGGYAKIACARLQEVA
jgi:CRISPR/Cas system-associated endonuclease Cas1